MLDSDRRWLMHCLDADVLRVEKMESDDIGLVKGEGYHFVNVSSMIWSRIVLYVGMKLKKIKNSYSGKINLLF